MDCDLYWRCSAPDKSIEAHESHLTATAERLRGDIAALAAFVQEAEVQVSDIQRYMGVVHGTDRSANAKEVPRPERVLGDQRAHVREK